EKRGKLLESIEPAHVREEPTKRRIGSSQMRDGRHGMPRERTIESPAAARRIVAQRDVDPRAVDRRLQRNAVDLGAERRGSSEGVAGLMYAATRAHNPRDDAHGGALVRRVGVAVGEAACQLDRRIGLAERDQQLEPRYV